ncbi:MAG TPA: alpha-amylase family glycosyl hydrolase [Tepidisphaeraceae bacterium]|nr:alpha-amylase family glycosyl hydrolase [Tepidisphaeraceae bacterium]
MSVTRRPVPELPLAPRTRPIAADLHRSYPTGRKDFSRAFAGKPMALRLTSAGGRFPAGVRARLVTTINAAGPGQTTEAPFEASADGRVMSCEIVPGRPGLFSFHAEFSTDGGQTWRHDPIPEAWVLVDPPQVDRMRLYTLIPAVSGPIAEWSARLPDIKAMGFDTVHLLPLTELDASRSPYSARALFRVEPGYLENPAGDGLAELEAFVEVARALGLRLCFDLVLNHVGVQSEIVRRAQEWVTPDESSPDGNRRARYYCDKGWLPWEDLVLIDYEHPSARVRGEVWRYMTEYALFWAHYADQTGGFVRFDNLHSSDKGFVDHVSAALRTTYPGVGIIAEYFTDVGTLLATIPAWHLNLVLATPWDARFVPSLREYLKYLHSVSGPVRWFMPVTSHDSGSPAQEFGAAESTRPRYVAAALLGTGATGITQGVEWGVARKIEFIGEQPRAPHEANPVYGTFLRRVNDVLVEEPALGRGTNCHFVDGGHDAVIAAFRTDDRPGRVGILVVCNFDIAGEQQVEIDLAPFLPPGVSAPVHCTDLLTGRAHEFAAAKLRHTIAPCGVHAFRIDQTGA